MLGILGLPREKRGVGMRTKRTAKERAIRAWIGEPDEYRTLYETIQEYETLASRAHKMPDWDELREKAWADFFKWEREEGRLKALADVAVALSIPKRRRGNSHG
jgi:hypothetical protein